MLDKNKDFGQVQGHPHAVYYQAGKHFNSRGQEIDLNTGKVTEKQVAEPVSPVQVPAPDPVTTPTFMAPEVPGDNNPVADEPDKGVDLESLAWQTIKKRVEAAGGIWSNKETGILYLRGLEE